jgi:hypothetical protein
MNPAKKYKRRRVEPPFRELSKEVKANFKRPPPPVTYAELIQRLQGTGLVVPHRPEELLQFHVLSGKNYGKKPVDNNPLVPATCMGSKNYPTYRPFPRDECELYWIQLNINVPPDHIHL